MGHWMPKLSFDTIHQIPFETLYKKGYRGIIIDLDNTLIPWSVKEASQKEIDFMNRIETMGFKVILFSNNSYDRVKLVADRLQVDFISRAQKPLSAKYIEALSILGTRASETMAIGDQFYTDIVGGNRQKILTILVRPYTMPGYGWTKFVHFLETPLRIKVDRRFQRGKK